MLLLNNIYSLITLIYTVALWAVPLVLSLCLGMQLGALYAFILMVLFNLFSFASLHIGLTYLIEISKSIESITDSFRDLNTCLDGSQIGIEKNQQMEFQYDKIMQY